MRRLLAATLAVMVFLPGCVQFLPTYNESIYGQLNTAITELGKVKAALSVPYQPAPNFEKIEPYYVASLGSLKSAEATSRSRANFLRGGLSERSSTIVAESIANCRKAVEGLAKLHKEQGITKQDFTDSSVTTACAMPKMMEEILKKRSG